MSWNRCKLDWHILGFERVKVEAIVASDDTERLFNHETTGSERIQWNILTNPKCEKLQLTIEVIPNF